MISFCYSNQKYAINMFETLKEEWNKYTAFLSVESLSRITEKEKQRLCHKKIGTENSSKTNQLK